MSDTQSGSATSISPLYQTGTGTSLEVQNTSMRPCDRTSARIQCSWQIPRKCLLIFFDRLHFPEASKRFLEPCTSSSEDEWLFL